MGMKRRSMDILVGLFVLAGIGALFFLALRAANLGSFVVSDGYELRANFDNIGGLKERAPVRSAGVVVGRVDSIDFDTQVLPGGRAAVDGFALPIPQGFLGQDPHRRPAGRAVHRHRGRRGREAAGRGRQGHADAIGRRAREPDQPVPLRSCRRRRGRGRSMAAAPVPAAPAAAAAPSERRHGREPSSACPDCCACCPACC